LIMTAHLSSNTLWASTEASAATNGIASGDWIATGVAIDSRSVKQGDLFIAIRGDSTDGHKYARAAIENGAVAVVIDQDVEGVPADKILKVADTFKAMQDLGIAARNRTAAKIIGITGSVGKTGTKEMLGRAFSALGQTHFSEKSLNNHWGVPLSLSRMHAGSDFAVFEMGMNHANEITPLTKMVKPHVAIITTVAPVHIEHFPEGVTGIAKAKAEIFDGMDEHGIAILNQDNSQFAVLKDAAQKCGIKKIFSFGKTEGADAWLQDCLIAANGTRITAKILGEEISFTLKDAGEHIALNALSVLLAVKLIGEDMSKAAEALKGIEPPAGRGKREYIDIGDKNNPITLIDESYNASPVAMEAAFKVMALIDPGRGGRRIAILGDMYELGSNAPQIHKDLALPLQAAGVDLVYTCGPLMKNLYDAIPEQNRGAHTENAPELAQIVPDVLVPGDVVLVKGSRGGGEIPRMQMVVEALREMPKKMSQAANKISKGT
jgi:UDP-N-acetylmuramoyl-tripeptide--D-alanyl-D-alanine ligase